MMSWPESTTFAFAFLVYVKALPQRENQHGKMISLENLGSRNRTHAHTNLQLVMTHTHTDNEQQQPIQFLIDFAYALCE